MNHLMAYSNFVHYHHHHHRRHHPHHWRLDYAVGLVVIL